jgi:hypothetical protein
MAEQLAEHLFDVIERMAVAVPQEDAVARLAAALALFSLLLAGGDDDGGVIV